MVGEKSSDGDITLSSVGISRELWVGLILSRYTEERVKKTSLHFHYFKG